MKGHTQIDDSKDNFPYVMNILLMMTESEIASEDQLLLISVTNCGRPFGRVMKRMRGEIYVNLRMAMNEFMSRQVLQFTPTYNCKYSRRMTKDEFHKATTQTGEKRLFVHFQMAY